MKEQRINEEKEEKQQNCVKRRDVYIQENNILKAIGSIPQNYRKKRMKKEKKKQPWRQQDYEGPSTYLEGSAVLHEAKSLPLAVLVLHQLKPPEFHHLVAATRHKATLRGGSWMSVGTFLALLKMG